MVPPSGLPAAWTYYEEGNVNFEGALLICAGFLLGGYVGAKFVTSLSNIALERIFCVAMLVIGVMGLTVLLTQQHHMKGGKRE